MSEAHATIDIVRAALKIPAAHASRRWIVIGDSEGGHASLSTGEIAPHYAPNLNLLGTVAIGPGAELSHTYPGDSPIVYDAISAMILFGVGATDPSIHPYSYLLPASQNLGQAIEQGCVTQITDAILNSYIQTGGKIFTEPLASTPEGQQWLKANEVGHVRTASPILVVEGGQDTIVVPDRAFALMKQLCSLHDKASFYWLPNANHTTEPSEASPEIESWVNARLNSKPAPTSCPFQQK